MNRGIFDVFFTLCEVSVGPTIISPTDGGNWIGRVKIIGTEKNILLKTKEQYIGIREYKTVLSDDVYNVLKYLTIEKSKFDYFINQYYLFEWENSDSKNKPDISCFKKRLQHEQNKI